MNNTKVVNNTRVYLYCLQKIYTGIHALLILMSEICVISSLRFKAGQNCQYSLCNSAEDRSFLPRFVYKMWNSDINRPNYMLPRYLTLYPYDTAERIAKGNKAYYADAKQSRYRPGVAQRVPGSEGSRIS